MHEDLDDIKPQEPSVMVPVIDLKNVVRLLTILRKCPPTLREIITQGDEAIDAAGLNPWCINEGANGDEKYLPWFTHDTIENIKNLM